MAFPALNEHLNYGKIPNELRHRRNDLFKYYNTQFEPLILIREWRNIDLNGVFVQTSHIKLIDAEIVELANSERRAVIECYTKKGRNMAVCPRYFVRDNHSGNIYLPQDCQIFSPC